MSTSSSSINLNNDKLCFTLQSNQDWMISLSNKKNKIYFFNTKTGESLWETPKNIVLTKQELKKIELLDASLGGLPNGNFNEVESIKLSTNSLRNSEPILLSSDNSPVQESNEIRCLEEENVSILDHRGKIRTPVRVNNSLTSFLKKDWKEKRKFINVENTKSDGSTWEERSLNKRQRRISESTTTNIPSNDFQMEWDNEFQEQIVETKPSAISLAPQHVLLNRLESLQQLQKTDEMLNSSHDLSPSRFSHSSNQLGHPEKISNRLHQLKYNNPRTSKELNVFDHSQEIIPNNYIEGTSYQFEDQYGSFPVSEDDDNESLEDNMWLIVIDTNVFLRQLNHINRFKNTEDFPGKFIVPYTVLEELDHIRASRGKLCRNARLAIASIHADLENQHPRIIGQTVPLDGSAKCSKTSTESDDLIIKCCLEYKSELGNTVLWTLDKNLISRALMNGIKSIDLDDLKRMMDCWSEQKQKIKKSRFGRTNNYYGFEEETEEFYDGIDTESWNQHTDCTTIDEPSVVESKQAVSEEFVKKVNNGKVPKSGSMFITNLLVNLATFFGKVFTLPNTEAIDVEESRTIVCNSLRKLQMDWENITHCKLLADVAMTLQVLKTITKPIEEITWTANNVEEIMTNVVNFAIAFSNIDNYSLNSTYLLLELNVIDNYKRNVINEIGEMNNLNEKRTCKEIILAQCALQLAVNQLKQECEIVALDTTNKDNVLQLTGKVSLIYDIIPTLQRMLKKNGELNSVRHPLIKKMHSALMTLLQESVPLPIDPALIHGEYCMADVTLYCIFMFCVEPSMRDDAKQIKEDLNIILGKIAKFYHDCCNSNNATAHNALQI